MNSQIRRWLEDPVTKCYLRLLQEHRAACIDRMLNMGTLDQTKLPELAQIKGQVNAFDLMLSDDQLDVFFLNELETDDK